jgi:hypothetical protein
MGEVEGLSGLAEVDGDGVAWLATLVKPNSVP